MGFDKTIGFPDINRIYISKRFFPIFDCRVMSSNRSNITSEKEKIVFLIKTNGKLVTDNISIFYKKKENVKKEFKNITYFQKIGKETSRTNEKEWLLTPDNLLCLYKITQIKDDKTSTNAHYSEAVYEEICNLLKYECSKIELVKSNKRKVIISYY